MAIIALPLPLARSARAHPGLWWVGTLFVASRLCLVAATLIAAHVAWPSVLSHPTSVPLWQTWRRWDADIYAQIAATGYVPDAIHTTPAFFPLMPLLERLLRTCRKTGIKRPEKTQGQVRPSAAP